LPERPAEDNSYSQPSKSGSPANIHAISRPATDRPSQPPATRLMSTDKRCPDSRENPRALFRPASLPAATFLLLGLRRPRRDRRAAEHFLISVCNRKQFRRRCRSRYKTKGRKIRGRCEPAKGEDRPWIPTLIYCRRADTPEFRPPRPL